MLVAALAWTIGMAAVIHYSVAAHRLADTGLDIAQVEKEARSIIPIGRYGDAAEFAAVAAFLASSRASYMTGGVIRVDGGMIRSV